MKAAEIKLAAALDKVKLLGIRHEEGALPNSAELVREARYAAELAEVDLERAKAAVELFEAENEDGAKKASDEADLFGFFHGQRF